MTRKAGNGFFRGTVNALVTARTWQAQRYVDALATDNATRNADRRHEELRRRGVYYF